MATIVAATWPAVKSCWPSRLDQPGQHQQMDDQADRADRGEQHEADRQQPAGRVMGDEAEEVEPDQRRQLRFAGLARPEHIGDLDDLQPPAGRQHDVDQDLEPVRRQARRKLRDRLAADHEEAAHRIADRHSRQQAEEPRAELAELLARRRQAARRGLVGDPRADRQLALARDQRGVHLRQDLFVVLQVAVDHRDVVGARRQPALDHRSRQAEPVDAADAAHARVVAGDREGDVGGAVGRIVVDDHHLPRQAVEHGLQPLEQHRHIGRFAVGRNDDGERRPNFRRRRIGCHLALARRRARRALRPHRRYGRGKARVKPRAGMTASAISSRPPRCNVTCCGGSKPAK